MDELGGSGHSRPDLGGVRAEYSIGCNGCDAYCNV
jgi:hypothetical protein